MTPESREDEREHCECPKCGRNHWKLANNPPAAIAGPSLLRPAETAPPDPLGPQLRRSVTERAAVVEQCAKVAEGWQMYITPRNDYDSGIDYAASQIAGAIRALVSE